MNCAQEGETNGDHDWFESSLSDAREHRHTLYGRDVEAAQLRDAYQRVTAARSDVAQAAATGDPSEYSLHHHRTEFVLIRGSMGVGKSGVAHSIRSHVEDLDGGYFIHAEFDGVEAREPYQALVEAFSDFATSAVERGDTLYFSKALREHGFVTSNRLFVMTPALQTLLEGPCEGTVDIDPAISCRKVTANDPIQRIFSTGDSDCFKEILCTFVRAIASRDKPVVLLLDDLHLANECSLHAIQALIECKDMKGVLFFGTVESSVEDDSVGLGRILHKLRSATVRQTTLELFPLNDIDTCTFFMAISRWDLEKATSLLAILAPQEKGSALFLWEYLRQLRKNKIICDDVSTVNCNLNLDTTHRNIGSLLVDGVRASVDDLSNAEKEYINIISCFGDKVDLILLSRLITCSKEDLMSFLDKCVGNGLLRATRNSWCFSSRVQKTMVYDVMTDSDKRLCHYRIGRKLWRVFDSDELNDFIFLVVDHLTFAMDDLDDNNEKTAIAKLCYFAGVRAFHLSSFCTSIRYLERGISLLGPGSWDESYDLCLDLYSATAEVATSLGLYERVYEVSGLVVLHAQMFSDSIRVQTSMTHALGISGRRMDATKLAFELLEKLGEPFPSRPSEIRTLFELTILRRRLNARSSESVLRLPTMVDTYKMAAMQILNVVFLPAYNVNPGFVPHIAFRLVRLTLDYGLCPVSCLGFAAYAGILCGLVGDIKQGLRIGQLSLLLYEKFDCRSWLARLSAVYFDFIHCWMRPFEEVRLPMENACRAGLESGDTEFAFTCGIVSLFSRFETDRLPDLAVELDAMVEQMKSYAARTNLLLTMSMRQMFHNFMTVGKVDPDVLQGEYFDEDAYAEIKTNHFLHPWTLLHKAMVALCFGRYAEASQYGKEARGLVRVFFGPRSAFGIFTCGLVDVVYAQVSNRRRAPFAKKCSRLLRRFATYGAPLNFMDKHYLLEAELATLVNKPNEALILFNAAIATASHGKKRYQTALANERTACFLRSQGDLPRATEYIHAAIASYRDYGAMAKVLHLQNEMSQFADSF